MPSSLLLALLFVVALSLVAALVTRVGQLRLDAAYPPTGRLIETTGGAVHLVERGPADAPVIVLIHGASGNHRDLMESIGTSLAERFRVIAVDRPGHGSSPRGASGASDLEEQARRIADALDTIGVTRATILGHSFGAAVALALAIDRPMLPERLILMTPVSHPWGGGAISWHNYIAATPIVSDLFVWTLPFIVGSAIMPRALEVIFAPDPVPERYQERIGSGLVLRPESFKANAQDVVRLEGNLDRLSRRYMEIAVPVTVVTGTRDKVVANAIHAEGLARDLNATRRIDIDAGHMPHWTATERVLEVVREALGR
jgi:pimeloyl-ACP methyl ester carboxylesterase